MKFRYYLLLAALSYWLGSTIIHNNHSAYFLSSDPEGYYMYLPALFIYGSFENYPTHTPAEYKFYPNTNKIATKKYLIENGKRAFPCGSIPHSNESSLILVLRRGPNK